jgi:hypothetical protein
MKWFKHDSDSSNDAKLKKLRLKYGAQGYGIYWYCLELIARNVEKHNLTFELEHDAELIADDFKLSSDLVQHIMTYMVELGLFEESNGMITCLKMASRTDEYTQKLLQSIKRCPDSITTVSSQNPKKSVLIEENRTEEIRLDKKKNIKYIPPIPAELFTEYQAIRKSKRAAPFTERMYNSLCKQASLAGITPEKAITICCEKGWTGFEASWLKQDKQASTLNAALSVFKPQYIAEQTAHIKLVGDNNADF